MVSPAVDKTIKQLKKTNLTLEDRTALTAVLLTKIGVLPLDNMIVVTNNSVTINGKKLEIDQVLEFKNSLEAFKENYARKVLTEQVKFLAINWGVHNGLTPESIMFSKAVLWIIQEEEKIINNLI